MDLRHMYIGERCWMVLLHCFNYRMFIGMLLQYCKCIPRQKLNSLVYAFTVSCSFTASYCSSDRLLASCNGAYKSLTLHSHMSV